MFIRLPVKIYEQGKKYYDALKSVNNLVKDARKVQQTGEDRIEQILQDNLRTTHVKGQSSGQ